MEVLSASFAATIGLYSMTCFFVILCQMGNMVFPFSYRDILPSAAAFSPAVAWAAPAAVTAAHHLVGDGGHLLTVDNNRAAIVLS